LVYAASPVGAEDCGCKTPRILELAPYGDVISFRSRRFISRKQSQYPLVKKLGKTQNCWALLPYHDSNYGRFQRLQKNNTITKHKVFFFFIPQLVNCTTLQTDPQIAFSWSVSGVHKFSKHLEATTKFLVPARSQEAKSVLRTHSSGATRKPHRYLVLSARCTWPGINFCTHEKNCHNCAENIRRQCTKFSNTCDTVRGICVSLSVKFWHWHSMIFTVRGACNRSGQEYFCTIASHSRIFLKMSMSLNCTSRMLALNHSICYSHDFVTIPHLTHRNWTCY